MDKWENDEILERFPECMKGYTFEFCNTTPNFSFGLEHLFDVWDSDSNAELKNEKCVPPLVIISDDSYNEYECHLFTLRH